MKQEKNLEVSYYLLTWRSQSRLLQPWFCTRRYEGSHPLADAKIISIGSDSLQDEVRFVFCRGH